MRAPLLQADLVGKRKQYAILSQAAAALGINAGDLERDLSNASKDPPLVDPAAERGRWFETVNRLKRLGRVASIAAVPMVLLFVGLTAAPALVGYSGESEPAPGERTGDVAARRIEVSPYIPSSAMEARGATFFTREVEFTFERGGRIIVSGEPPPGGAFSVDDGSGVALERGRGECVDVADAALHTRRRMRRRVRAEVDTSRVQASALRRTLKG